MRLVRPENRKTKGDSSDRGSDKRIVPEKPVDTNMTTIKTKCGGYFDL